MREHARAVCTIFLSVTYGGEMPAVGMPGAGAPYVKMRDGGAIEDVHLSLLVCQ
jgi:hypothetical protein